MKLKRKIDVEIELTKEDLFECIKNSRIELEIADYTLGLVSWHNNMPKSLKLQYIAMMEQHIFEFKSELDRNLD